MKSLNPYLNFAGRTEEALAFYKECFAGKIESQKTFADVQMDVPDDWQQKICHAEFRAEDIYFMASDGMGQECPASNAVSLSLNFTDLSATENVFAALAQGGEVKMALNKTFWGATFGIVQDKFGFTWMLNCGDEMKDA